MLLISDWIQSFPLLEEQYDLKVAIRKCRLTYFFFSILVFVCLFVCLSLAQSRYFLKFWLWFLCTLKQVYDEGEILNLLFLRYFFCVYFALFNFGNQGLQCWGFSLFISLDYWRKRWTSWPKQHSTVTKHLTVQQENSGKPCFTKLTKLLIR